jgi:lipid-binding SYLF domain-containing protein
MRRLTSAVIGFFIAGWLLHAGAADAQARDVIDAGVRDALKQFNQLDRRNERLSDGAAGILVFPQITKGGIALAGEYGEGALLVNGATVDYYSIASASVGLTAGMATHTEVILFVTPEALRKFQVSRGWSVGADGSVAVMARGVSEDYDSVMLNKPVLVFVFGEKGLIADLSLNGSRIQKIKK